jgi:CRP-like cAMP-binding protein
MPPDGSENGSRNGSSGRSRPGSSGSRIALREAAPELSAFLPADERFVLDQISVPVVHVSNGSLPLAELLERRGAFAALVVQGLVLHQLAIGSAPGLRILGPGDVISLADGMGPTVVGWASYQVRPSTRLALLGNDFLAAARRAPRVLVGLQAATAEQMERLAAQLVICQMPRVADRVHAMLWLLADSFGRVTPAGTRLPLTLTHEVIGALVGARRPTVTLALGELAKRGAVVHQDGGWLLLEPVETVQGNERGLPEEPQLLEQSSSEWAGRAETGWAASQTLAALIESVSRLREEHQLNVEQFRDRLRRVAASRERSSQIRRRVRAGRSVSRPRLPSA